METGLAQLGEISPRARWDLSQVGKNFHMSTSSHLTGMDIYPIFADFDLEYSIERHNLKIQTIEQILKDLYRNY